MTLIANPQGCKVGWAVYDDEQEAIERSKTEAAARERKFAQGYDFGYLWPGSIKQFDDHPDYDSKTVWVVVTT